jgi:hypothetical protein
MPQPRTVATTQRPPRAQIIPSDGSPQLVKN